MRGAVQPRIALRAATVRAHRATRPVDTLKMLARRIFVVESGFGMDRFGHVIAPGMKQ
jgi:hypothetical protein